MTFSKQLLVDFENIQQIDLSQIDDHYSIYIFVGMNQKSIPVELVVQTQKLGTRVEWQRVDGIGSNALDFFIACHLGQMLEKRAAENYIVLSKDKGFDPLIRHLNSLGLKCSRVNSLMELEPDSPQTEGLNYRKVLDALNKNRKTRPRKRKTLAQYILTTCSNKISQTEVDYIIDVLFANKMISEDGNNLNYAF